MYAELNNNIIVKIWTDLPSSWKNISGFDQLSNNQIYDLSWAGYPEYSFLPIEASEYPQNLKCCNIITGPIYTLNEITQTVQQSWNIDPKPDSDCWNCIRSQRNVKLRLCDWTQLPDSPLSPSEKLEYQNYRQALRDITLQLDPKSVIWPTEPSIS